MSWFDALSLFEVIMLVLMVVIIMFIHSYAIMIGRHIMDTNELLRGIIRLLDDRLEQKLPDGWGDYPVINNVDDKESE